MKIMSAACLCFVLMLHPARAEDAPAAAGDMVLEGVPKPGDSLTIHFARPRVPAAAEDEEDIATRLVKCAARWNRSLASFEQRLPKLQAYIAYYRKWENYPAQRPPKSPETLLTRASYRACLYKCLGDTNASCPVWSATEGADR